MVKYNYITNQLLPLGCVGGFNVPYFSKEKILTKSHIYQEFIGDQDLLKYLPDNLKLTSITRELLLSILFYIKRDKYLNLYGLYKNKKIERATNGIKVYNIKIKDDLFNKLRNYSSVGM